MSNVIAITSIIDDIYDAYGTYEEIQIFTEAIERFEMFTLKLGCNDTHTTYAAKFAVI